MQIIISNLKYNRTNNNLNRKKKLKKSYQMTAEYLSRRFASTYELQSSSFDVFNHLIKIFLYYLNDKVEKISLIKTTNQDNTLNLEFKVHPSYFNKTNGIESNHNQSNIISIDKFFKENYKYIIV